MTAIEGDDTEPHAGRVGLLFTRANQEPHFLSDSLRKSGLQACHHQDNLGLMAAMKEGEIDIAVVEDEGLTLASCLSACRLHGLTNVPVIAWGRGTAEQIAAALSRGAVDYALRDDAPAGIVSRVRARLMLQALPALNESLEVSGLVLDEPTRTLRGPAIHHALTGREFALAWVLFEHAGRVVAHDTLAHHVWGQDTVIAKRTIEQHVSKLRRKLLEVSMGCVESLELQAVHNVGYRLTKER